MSSCEEGPSNPKGKGVDPCNWGNANLDELEVDLDAQREALETWAQTHEWSKKAPEQENREEIQQLKQELEKRNGPPVKKVKIRPPKKDRAPKTGKEPKGSNPVKEMLDKMGSKPSKRGDRATPPAMDAVAQIVPKSYLGHAFMQIKPKKKGIKKWKG
ncbi:hypothetical protein DFJ58DRAFT_728201 [Suillus subalutaceus]|uniref:uncharacterized protein n=1 Tax=Suillus subalutaceus TaxID=48586 RepID=UPI001B85D0C4|nr:uncharacterized protein DFJ58DRAFT_728201 [Suillus subalutaceus]KAG1853450.1 hypothetical protein DFJ58DRAFT_728201 [Suillus subalutaceus]